MLRIFLCVALLSLPTFAEFVVLKFVNNREYPIFLRPDPAKPLQFKIEPGETREIAVQDKSTWRVRYATGFWRRVPFASWHVDVGLDELVEQSKSFAEVGDDEHQESIPAGTLKLYTLTLEEGAGGKYQFTPKITRTKLLSERVQNWLKQHFPTLNVITFSNDFIASFLPKESDDKKGDEKGDEKGGKPTEETSLPKESDDKKGDEKGDEKGGKPTEEPSEPGSVPNILAASTMDGAVTHIAPGAHAEEDGAPLKVDQEERKDAEVPPAGDLTLNVNLALGVLGAAAILDGGSK